MKSRWLAWINSGRYARCTARRRKLSLSEFAEETVRRKGLSGRARDQVSPVKREGQFLLPMLELVEQTEVTIDEVIQVMGRGVRCRSGDVDDPAPRVWQVVRSRQCRS